MGTNDLVKELGARHVPGREPLLTSLSLALLAARRPGVAILDGVYNDVTDLDGFGAECRQGRDLGFDGKTLIHPGQVEPCNAVFAPSARGGRGGPRRSSPRGRPAPAAGVVTHRGKMVENLHVEIAREGDRDRRGDPEPGLSHAARRGRATSRSRPARWLAPTGPRPVFWWSRVVCDRGYERSGDGWA